MKPIVNTHRYNTRASKLVIPKEVASVHKEKLLTPSKNMLLKTSKQAKVNKTIERYVSTTCRFIQSIC